MRISETILAGIALLALAGCDQRQVKTKAEQVQIKRGEEARAAAEGRIPCAVGGKGAFDLVCTIDRAHTQDGLILTIRYPDGGFHRLRVTTDGRGVVAADGAREAVVSVIDKDAIEVAIEDARYRLPATIKGGK
ncbi:hypothetical protein [Sphingomonas sp.]|uniref:hypothetical protein n=1 Tax=Sphingomonas sp. TaxID=28214 RepID=UPI0025CFF9BD|nr:hypothetical protein [Sphingomonas sp.]